MKLGKVKSILVGVAMLLGGGMCAFGQGAIPAPAMVVQDTAPTGTCSLPQPYVIVRSTGVRYGCVPQANGYGAWQVDVQAVIPVMSAPTSCAPGQIYQISEGNPNAGQLYSDNGSGGCTQVGGASSLTLSGDVTGAANANTVGKINNAAIPLSAPSLGSNSSGQFINTAPAVTFTMLAAAGTSPPAPTCATGVNCTEKGGIIFWGTGTGASSSGDMLEINMSNNGFVRTCIVSGSIAWSGHTGNNSAAQYHASTSSTTEAVMYMTSGIVSSTNYISEYVCQ